MKERTYHVASAAVLAAMLCASAWVSVPLQPVPVTFQVLVVVLAALVLPPRWAAASVLAYLVIGASGVPVFSGAKGGLQVLAGPTGGYLWGFVFGAVLGSASTRAMRRARIPLAGADAAAAILVIACVYALGWLQLSFVMHLTPLKALLAGVVPFLPVDALKAAVAVGLAAALRRSGFPRSDFA